MSEAPRRINTERSLNRPTEKRPAEAPASKMSDSASHGKISMYTP